MRSNSEHIKMQRVHIQPQNQIIQNTLHKDRESWGKRDSNGECLECFTPWLTHILIHTFISSHCQNTSPTKKACFKTSTASANCGNMFWFWFEILNGLQCRCIMGKGNMPAVPSQGEGRNETSIGEQTK